MQPLQLRFTYTEAEYLGASQLVMLRGTTLIIRLIVFSVLILFGASMFSIMQDFIVPLWAVVLIALLLDVALVYKVFVDMPRRYFRGDAKLRDEYRLTFSEDHIRIQTSQIDSKLAWSLYTRALENSSLYVLVYGKDNRMMTVVPKRAFPTAQEELQFRNLVHNRVDKRLPPTNANLDRQVSEYAAPRFEPPDWR